MTEALKREVQQTSVRIDPDVYEWMRQYAFDHRRSQSWVVEQALRMMRYADIDMGVETGEDYRSPARSLAREARKGQRRPWAH